MRRFVFTLATLAPLVLAGCDMLGIESASQAAARREADGRAIGAGCRHAARSVEQCYALNRRAERAAIFAGWKEMNDYMAENKIEAVPPPPEPKETTASEEAEAAEPETKAEKKPAKVAARESR